MHQNMGANKKNICVRARSGGGAAPGDALSLFSLSSA